MDKFDSIFSASSLDESCKKAKMIFGKLLIALRKENRIKLYSILGGVIDTALNDNVIELRLSDKTSYDMINNKSDIETINNLLNSISNGIVVRFECEEREQFNVYKFEERLKKEFGKMLVIKK